MKGSLLGGQMVSISSCFVMAALVKNYQRWEAVLLCSPLHMQSLASHLELLPSAQHGDSYIGSTKYTDMLMGYINELYPWDIKVRHKPYFQAQSMGKTNKITLQLALCEENQ